MTTTRDEWKIAAAQKIQAHHDAAHKAADKAIEHAKQAGVLLLEIKAALPHGDFSLWVEKHLTVSIRQAQRYMAAAQGKAISVRKVKQALPVPVKYDTVSLFKIRPGEAVSLKMDRGGWVDELNFFPSTHEGCFHYIYRNGPKDGDKGHMVAYSTNPIPAQAVTGVVFREMHDWEFANITRSKSEGLEYNLIGTTTDGVDWIGSPPLVTDEQDGAAA